MESHTIPFYVEEGQKLHEGPQLLRSHGAQEQVEVMAHKNKSKSWRTRTSRGGLYKSEKSGK